MNGTTARKRPVWVWIISIFYILASVVSLVSISLLLSGIVPVSSDLSPKLAATVNEQLTGSTPFFIIIDNCLYLATAISLFRLRKVAFYLFAMLLGISLFSIGVDGLYGTLFDWLILLAICIYTWTLKQEGILR